jgi:L-threonylcarbamoyladenylate synthase
MSFEPSTEILATHTPALFAAAVHRTADVLRAGQLAVVPTETVYGLAARADSPAAVARIFEVKGRPAHNPIIVHVVGLAMARACVAEWPAAAERVARAFWPGPLTIVLPRAAAIPDGVTAGGPTVGIRWPGHPFMQALIRECGFPLAAPSANPANGLSPTQASHVLRTLGGRVPLIVDGGPCHVGVESTVLDLTCEPARVLRPGMVLAPALVAVLGELASGPGTPDGPLRSPGQLQRHYAPRTRLLVLRWADEADLKRQLEVRGIAPAGTHVAASMQIPSPAGFAGVSVIPHDAEAFARALYAELHRCDESGATCIVVEAVPDAPEWGAVADRLRRAGA